MNIFRDKTDCKTVKYKNVVILKEISNRYLVDWNFVN